MTCCRLNQGATSHMCNFPSGNLAAAFVPQPVLAAALGVSVGLTLWKVASWVVALWEST